MERLIVIVKANFVSVGHECRVIQSCTEKKRQLTFTSVDLYEYTAIRECNSLRTVAATFL